MIEVMERFPECYIITRHQIANVANIITTHRTTD